MNELISQVISTFQFQAKASGARIEVSELPACMGDTSQINQVFSNLIGNAFKFFAPDRPGTINISSNKEDNHSVYCVEDNGVGIAPEHQEKIFEIFYQLVVYFR